MKITDYQSITSLKDNTSFITEGPDGTRHITAKDLSTAIKAMLGGGLGIDTLDDFYSLCDRLQVPVTFKKNIFRGKNLGPLPVTEAQKEEIRNGTFRDLFLGDYWTQESTGITGGVIKYRIVDFNYWYPAEYNDGTMDVNGLRDVNHLVIMPDTHIGLGKYDTGPGSKNGYGNSLIYQVHLNSTLLPIVKGHFSTTQLHKWIENLPSACDTTYGYGTAYAKFNVCFTLPSERMMTGAQIVAANSDANVRMCMDCSYADGGQLSLMRLDSRFIYMEEEEDIFLTDEQLAAGRRSSLWLSDLCLINGASSINASRSIARLGKHQYIAYIRPIFGIEGYGY